MKSKPIDALQILEDDFEGEKLLYAVLPAPPVEALIVFAPDTTTDSRELLQELSLSWTKIWPKLKRRVTQGIRDYKVDQLLGRDQCALCVSRMEPGYFMSDKSEIMLRLEFLEPPLWDCFLKGTKIAHFQAVF
jgi:hypothetical protein